MCKAYQHEFARLTPVTFWSFYFYNTRHQRNQPPNCCSQRFQYPVPGTVWLRASRSFTFSFIRRLPVSCWTLPHNRTESASTSDRIVVKNEASSRFSTSAKADPVTGIEPVRPHGRVGCGWLLQLLNPRPEKERLSLRAMSQRWICWMPARCSLPKNLWIYAAASTTAFPQHTWRGEADLLAG